MKILVEIWTFFGAFTMPLEVEATYENGMLKLDRPLPLDDNQRVRVVVKNIVRHAKRSYGLMGWNGDPNVIEQIALDPDLDVMESP